jgi:hypothetical protein
VTVSRAPKTFAFVFLESYNAAASAKIHGSPYYFSDQHYQTSAPDTLARRTGETPLSATAVEVVRKLWP